MKKRATEADEGKKSIDELIEHFDGRKENIITQIINNVSKHFVDVFKEVVPEGDGRLLAIVEDGKYVGVNVLVSFIPGQEVSLNEVKI